MACFKPSLLMFNPLFSLCRYQTEKTLSLFLSLHTHTHTCACAHATPSCNYSNPGDIRGSMATRVRLIYSPAHTHTQHTIQVRCKWRQNYIQCTTELKMKTQFFLCLCSKAQGIHMGGDKVPHIFNLNNR